jgi:hypothetical protein
VFRLFRTKKELFLAPDERACERCSRPSGAPPRRRRRVSACRRCLRLHRRAAARPPRGPAEHARLRRRWRGPRDPRHRPAALRRHGDGGGRGRAGRRAGLLRQRDAAEHGGARSARGWPSSPTAVSPATAGGVAAGDRHPAWAAQAAAGRAPACPDSIRCEEQAQMRPRMPFPGHAPHRDTAWDPARHGSPRQILRTCSTP